MSVADAERSGARRFRLWIGAGVAGGLIAAAAVPGGTALWGADEPPAAAGPPVLEETTTSGIDHVYDGEFAFFVGGGVAILDCDANGLPDADFWGRCQPGLARTSFRSPTSPHTWLRSC